MALLLGALVLVVAGARLAVIALTEAAVAPVTACLGGDAAVIRSSVEPRMVAMRTGVAAIWEWDVFSGRPAAPAPLPGRPARTPALSLTLPAPSGDVSHSPQGREHRSLPP